MKTPDKEKLQEWFTELTTFKKNDLHPLVWIVGNPVFGENVYIGAFSEVNANESNVYIGDNCDIASFVSINCADSHQRCLERTQKVIRKKIKLESNVFVGSHSVIKGGAHIGHHSVVAAGTIVECGLIPPYSLIVGNPMKVKPGYYNEKN
jgi:acetyltransferase-like isoleucine patch superfamily enzyme